MTVGLLMSKTKTKSHYIFIAKENNSAAWEISGTVLPIVFKVNVASSSFKSLDTA